MLLLFKIGFRRQVSTGWRSWSGLSTESSDDVGTTSAARREILCSLLQERKSKCRGKENCSAHKTFHWDFGFQHDTAPIQTDCSIVKFERKFGKLLAALRRHGGQRERGESRCHSFYCKPVRSPRPPLCVMFCSRFPTHFAYKPNVTEWTSWANAWRASRGPKLRVGDHFFGGHHNPVGSLCAVCVVVEASVFGTCREWNHLDASLARTEEASIANRAFHVEGRWDFCHCDVLGMRIL